MTSMDRASPSVPVSTNRNAHLIIIPQPANGWGNIYYSSHPQILDSSGEPRRVSQAAALPAAVACGTSISRPVFTS